MALGTWLALVLSSLLGYFVKITLCCWGLWHCRKVWCSVWAEVGTVAAEDTMDDGTPICLAVTIDRSDGSAVFDFEGAHSRRGGRSASDRRLPTCPPPLRLA